MRFLVAESEPEYARAARRESVGRSSGETYVDLLGALEPDATCERTRPADADGASPGAREIAAFDAVFLTGSPLHLYQETPETRRQIEFMRAVFSAGTPAFGSCAGLQVAAVAAGGTVRAMRRPTEAGFARRITRTDAGRGHPMLAGRPSAWDAPSVHGDEVERLPPGASHLASNGRTEIQAAEIRYEAGVFWGVQYHPEISLHEVAAALRRDADSLIEQGLVRDRVALEDHVGRIEALHVQPGRLDVLAVNAGVGLGGAFVETDLDRELAMIDLNVRGSVQLTKLVLKDMVARDAGKLLFTSSIAATMPDPFEAVYGATKVFLRWFGEALRNELKDTNVGVTVLMPSVTDTDFFNRAEMLDTKAGASDKKDDPAGVARQAFEALQAGRDKVVPNLKNKVMGAIADALPQPVAAAVHRGMSEPGSAQK